MRESPHTSLIRDTENPRLDEWVTFSMQTPDVLLCLTSFMPYWGRGEGGWRLACLSKALSKTSRDRLLGKPLLFESKYMVQYIRARWRGAYATHELGCEVCEWMNRYVGAYLASPAWWNKDTECTLSDILTIITRGALSRIIRIHILVVDRHHDTHLLARIQATIAESVELAEFMSSNNSLPYLTQYINGIYVDLVELAGVHPQDVNLRCVNAQLLRLTKPLRSAKCKYDADVQRRAQQQHDTEEEFNLALLFDDQ